ncbi:hypothetical protein F2P81_017893 [Scophthalmus maximus]|uniref:Uncharacterized protein n=1 Tax=Scophthalmus maximus TaxID=52904 RepID=A0A6A4S970_SCOMX|nr:hypothetical protein F2P81_017893 [Scophthalmus maximus]
MIPTLTLKWMIDFSGDECQMMENETATHVRSFGLGAERRYVPEHGRKSPDLKICVFLNLFTFTQRTDGLRRETALHFVL